MAVFCTPKRDHKPEDQRLPLLEPHIAHSPDGITALVKIQAGSILIE